jgi:hypothetical protein
MILVRLTLDWDEERIALQMPLFKSTYLNRGPVPPCTLYAHQRNLP